MSDVDLSEFLEAPAKETCIVAKAIEKLSAEDRVKISAAFEAEHITTAAIHQWLLKRNPAVKDGTLRKHRRHACVCHG